MLHDCADYNLFAIAGQVNVNLDRCTQEVIQQHRALVGHLNRIMHVTIQLFLAIHNFHGPPTQNIGGTYNQWISNLLRRLDTFFDAAHRAIGWLFQAQLLNQLLEALTVLCPIDGIGTGSNHRHTGLFQTLYQVQRGLPAKLNDNALRLLQLNDFDYVFERQWLEVQAIRDIVISRYCLRVTIDHDGIVAIFAHGECGMHTAIIELYALPYTVRPSAQHHYLIPIGRRGFALLLIGRIHVGRRGNKLGSAGIYPLIDWPNS